MATSLIPSTRRLRTLAAYAAMLAVAAGVYLFIRGRGEQLVAPAVDVVREAHVAHSSTLATVLLALAVIIVMARGLGHLFQRWFGQPPVIGEIVAGLVLGPSVLGAISPEAAQMLLPAAAAPFLGILSKVGVVLFMFLVGLELDPKMLRGNGHATLAISHASIVAPFLLGATLALGLYPLYSNSSVSFTVFSLFLGVSLSVTAFPVLARILTDRRVQSTPLGVTALTCAAIDDVSAWSLLALVVSVASAQAAGVAWTVGAVVVYLLVMFVAVRPLLVRFAASEDAKTGPLAQSAMAVVFVALLLSAVATEAAGVHALFGAFLLGTFLPHEGRLAEQVRLRLEDAVVVLFLPAFFAFTGMRTQINLVDGATDWLICGLIILMATLGKFGGSFAAARLTGLGWRESAALGVLMNTRGLMELIVLNVGLDMGVLSPTLFAMLVIMALVTTFATTPVLNMVMGERGFADAPARAPVDVGHRA
ncbi:MAG TPA: cation:proton antiporter [Nannocystis sp.]|jgi:Kef-type K+ transport system membrane component KefB